MKILLINVHSTQNAGDAVLNRATLRQLEAALPQATITMAMNDTAHHDPAVGEVAILPSFVWWAKRPQGRWRPLTLLAVLLSSLWLGLWWRKRPFSPHNHPLARRLPWFPLLQAYAEADLVVSCAGNFLYSSGVVGLPLLLAIYTIGYGWLLGKPLYMMPQTIGPLQRRWERRLIGWVLGKMRWVAVRDVLSQRLVVDELGIPAANCQLLPDIAFAFPPAPPEAGRALLAAYGVEPGQRPLLGVSLINWGAQNRLFTGQAEYETAVVAALRHFVQQTGAQVLLFSQVQGPQAADDDRIPARRVAAQLTDTDTVFIDRPVTPDTLKSAYSYMDLFLGTRLHANIFALSEGVPVLPIQYQYKTEGIMAMLGLTDWVLPIEEVTAATLTPRLLAAWQARATTRAQVQRVLPPLVAQASRLGAHIQEDFDNA